MNPLERSQWTNLFFLSRSSCQVGMAGGNPAYTTISIRSRPVFGPARKSRSFSQSSPRPAVRTELPTFDSSTSTRSLGRDGVLELFPGILLSLNSQIALIQPPAPTIGNRPELLNSFFALGYESTTSAQS